MSEFQSWAPEVQVEGTKWSRNALRFATKEEAEANARDLMMRWFAVRDSQASPATEPVNYQYIDGVLIPVE